MEGREIEIEDTYSRGVLTYAPLDHFYHSPFWQCIYFRRKLPFKCSIQPRSEQIRMLIESTRDRWGQNSLRELSIMGAGAGWKSHVTHRESTSKHTGNCIDITPENDTGQITNLTEHKEISVLLTAIQVIQIFLHIRVTIMIWGNFCMVSMHPQYHDGAEISSQQSTHLLCRNFFTTNQTFVMKKFPQNNLYLYYTEISS